MCLCTAALPMPPSSGAGRAALSSLPSWHCPGTVATPVALKLAGESGTGKSALRPKQGRVRSQHAQVGYGGREAEQDEDKPLSPGATTATLDELENCRDAVWAGNGTFTLTTAGLTLKRQCGYWGSNPQLQLVDKGRQDVVDQEDLETGSCQTPPVPPVLLH